MKMLIQLSILFVATLSHVHAGSDTSRPSNYENPFKGLSTFVFTSQFPGTKKIADEVNPLIKNTLDSFGKVIPSSMLIQTTEGESVSLSSFDSGAFLTYTISELLSIDGKKLEIISATLTLQTMIEVTKTKIECMPYLWTQSCFFKGSIDKMESCISQSLPYLLKRFSSEYTLVNQESPTFNLYQ